MNEQSRQNSKISYDDQSVVSGSKSSQIAYGDYSAVAGPYGTAIVNVYQQAPPGQITPDEIEKAKQQLSALPLEAVPNVADLPCGSRMPFRHNQLFVGREDDLKALARVLKGAQTAVVTGLGGIGKTQLAIEFVHRYGQYFAGGVFWLNFSDPDAISSGVSACGGVGGFELRPDYHTLTISDQVRLVSAAWQSSLPRLLVFDNCEEETLLAQWHPPTGECRVLVTSRRAVWNIALKVHTLALGVLDRKESILLLQKHWPDLTVDDADLDAIAEELGDLPLALHLAGGFLSKYHRIVTPTAYLSQLRDKALLEHPSLEGRGTTLSPTDHELHIAGTFALSYGRLDATDTIDVLARALLARVAYFAPGEPIPRDLLWQTLDLVDTDFEIKLQVEDALTRLVELGLLEEGVEESLRQHRLLTAFTRAVSHHETQAQEAVENTLIGIFQTSNQTGNLSKVRTIEPHLRAVTELAMQREGEQAVLLCNVLGNHLRNSANYLDARFYLERALAIDEALFGKDNPGTSLSLNDLGLVLSRIGHHEAAKTYLERALRLFEKKKDFPNAAASLDNLGQLSTAAGDYENARVYLKYALEIREQILGPEHPRTAVSLQSLGDLLAVQGNYAEAKDNYERALAIRERTPGKYSRATASSLSSIGALIEEQGNFAKAVDYREQALEIYDNLLGPDNPVTVLELCGLIRPLILNGMVKRASLHFVRLKTCLDEHDVDCWPPFVLNNLGLTLWFWGDCREAIKYYELAYQVDHSDAIILNNLAMALVPLERYQAAREHYEAALEIQQQKGVGGRLLKAKLLNNFGALRRIVSEFKKARTHFEQALKIRKEMLGLAHRDTATTLSNLGLLFQDEGDFTIAQQYIEQALTIYQQLFGNKHPDIAKSLNDFGALLYAQDKLIEAQAYLDQALTMREQTLPDYHPYMADTLTNLGKVVLAQGDEKQAGVCFERALAIYKLRYGDSHSSTREISAHLTALEEHAPMNMSPKREQ